ncbi:HAD-IIIC family phosphatase [Algibacillus agarilyticus]|uniref:HAD-IIIC family phosphatase n=1 Tax=Algibacillus agarilyticus TaxID=2234133 RepID=UPI000DD0D64F|nr:HAD-IIIC family phosphatase [Algibacillus agarilyticus]
MSVDQTEVLKQEQKQRIVKCVVWDLDNTLWDGTLLEGGIKGLRPNVFTVIKTLDERGILQSIASKNDHQSALSQLEQLGLTDYFLSPQINWGAKSGSIERIAKDLNIGLDTFAFIDDQAFEREEVSFAIPEVLCIDAADTDKIPELPEFKPRFITEDSARRRQMYQADLQRQTVEEHFDGPQEKFLTSLEMKLSINPAGESDLKRAEELTLRTNQLNTTGYTYSYDELNLFRQSYNHQLLVASLEDKYGDYGKIGLVLIERFEGNWVIKLLLMSCRVMARGVGTVLINHLRNQARNNHVRLLAEMLPNDRNRMMYMTYKFNHFSEIDKQGELVIFENDLKVVHEFPNYFQLNIGDL